MIGSLAHGVALGLQFNPLTSVVGCVIAAALAGYPGAPEHRRPLSVGVLALAWLVGDGVGIGTTLASKSGAPLWPAALAWIVLGVLVGYVVPTLVGVAVGTRVIRGTGWLSAGAVALASAGALSVVSPWLADVVAKLV